MNLQDRIARRQSAHQTREIVVDRDQLSPTVHRSEPIGRGPVFEDLLDALEPVFDEQLPDPVAVAGPAGAGTSALVSALFEVMNKRFGEADRAIGTTTRSRSRPITWFVTIDARRVDSPFALYRTLLAAISSESVPTSGIGTDELCTRLGDRLERHDRQAVIALDHHDEPETLSYGRVTTLLEPVSDAVSLVAVGQEPPAEWGGQTVSVPAYRHHELVDVITDRTSTGLAPGALEHELIRTLADRADGNAHDALAALFSAVVLATEDGATRIEQPHLEQAWEAVHEDGVHLDRGLALSETRQQVLSHLISIDAADQPVRELATAIAEQSALTESTVTRLLYELADRGVLERVALPSTGSGRRPSTLEPRIPTIPFRAMSQTKLE